MILNLLEQAGLSGRVDGEYLQGGVGELQAVGLVRVMVEERDYAEAKRIVQAWDAKQPTQEPQPAVKKKSSLSTGLTGFFFGIVVMVVYNRTPVTEDGVDYNGDGTLDERWTYVNDRMSKVESDRNLDGRVDSIFLFDRKGLLESSSSDGDFNGTFETQTDYDNGNAVWQRSDTTGDGFSDVSTTFRHGILSTVTFRDPGSRRPIKIQEYGAFKLKRAEADTDGDGIMDVLYEYDAIEDATKIPKK